MRTATALALYGLVAALTACDDGGSEGPACVDTRDCAPGVCFEGLCVAPDDPRLPLDGGSSGVVLIDDPVPVRPDAGVSATPDAGRGGAVDLGADAGLPDAQVADAGTLDSGGPDQGTADLGSPDAGAAPIIAAPGRYAFRPFFVAGMNPREGLWRVAVSPDDRWIVASAYYDQIFVIDRASKLLARTIRLTASGAERVRIGDAVFLPSGEVLVTATALSGTFPSGRMYVFSPGVDAPPIEVARERGMWLERAALEGTAADVIGWEDLGGGRYVMSLFRLDVVGRVWTRRLSQTTSAGCEGLALAADGLGGRGQVYTCGLGGGEVGHVDAFGGAYSGPGIGNVSYVDGHPSGDYALAVAWASARLARFEAGVWTSGSAAPDLRTARLQNIAFSSDGRRALIVGGYEPLTRRAEMREYRDGAYSTQAVTDVSISGFDQTPFLGINGSGLFDASWRPGCDGGYVVGGCGSLTCGRGWLLEFDVTNGRQCR